MIDLYTWTTPNGRKVSIALEEMGLDYTVHPVNLGEGDQFKPAFQALSPNGRIPAIHDHETGITLMESGAILIYLAEKSGRFLPASGVGRAKVLEWLMWQMGNLGPMLGQANHFANSAPEKIPYAIERYINESVRLYEVMEKRLGDVEYLGGEYSIADMITYPWAVLGFPIIKGMKEEMFGAGSNVERWLEAVGARPAVQKGVAVPKVD